MTTKARRTILAVIIILPVAACSVALVAAWASARNDQPPPAAAGPSASDGPLQRVGGIGECSWGDIAWVEWPMPNDPEFRRLIRKGPVADFGDGLSRYWIGPWWVDVIATDGTTYHGGGKALIIPPTLDAVCLPFSDVDHRFLANDAQPLQPSNLQPRQIRLTINRQFYLRWDRGDPRR